VTALLAGIDVAARLVARYALPSGTDPFLVGALSVLAMVLVLGVAAFLWARRRRVPAVAADLFFVIVATTLVVTVVGPFVSGTPDFGVGSVIQQAALCAALLTVGGGGGVLTAVALGLDPTSRAWQAQAERAHLKPGPERARPRGKTARQSGARR
jgi:hypothetical protein